MSEATMKALEQADDLLARGKIKQAIDALRASVRGEPDNRRALNRLGDLYVKSDQQDRAIAMFRRIGGGFEEDGLSAQAIALYKKVVRIDPEQWDAYEKLGDLYNQQNLPFEAAAQYETAAKAYIRQSDFPAAIRALRGVVDNRPDDAAARASLAEIYLSSRRTEQAMEEYSQIGEMMVAAGQADQAVQMYVKVLESHFDADFGQRAVRTLDEAGQPATAARLLALVEQLQGERSAGIDVESAEVTHGSSEEVLAVDLEEDVASSDDTTAVIAPTATDEAAEEAVSDDAAPEVTVEAEPPAADEVAPADDEEIFEIDLTEVVDEELAEGAGGDEDLRGLGAEVEGSLMVEAASGAETESDSIEEIVADFTQGLASALSPDDFDTHYNLGLGYQEMGLIDEAIGEFQVAAKSPDHLINAASMLGYAFRQRGLYDLAFEWYERARNSEVATDEQRLAMRYEQAETEYEAEEIERAYELYQEVYGVDSTFRDVAQRIDELRTG